MQRPSKGCRLLTAFTQILAASDPMDLGSLRSDEYEVEALSLLARFNEHHVGSLAQEAFDVAHAIVHQVFQLWFYARGPWEAHVEKLAQTLLTAYMAEPAACDDGQA